MVYIQYPMAYICLDQIHLEKCKVTIEILDIKETIKLKYQYIMNLFKESTNKKNHYTESCKTLTDKMYIFKLFYCGCYKCFLP
jgi:hypothetical protein